MGRGHGKKVILVRVRPQGLYIPHIETPLFNFVAIFDADTNAFPTDNAFMTRLVLGSRNKKKLREMIDLLGDLAFDLTDLSPYPNAPEVDETADTFVGNATLKAVTLAPALGEWTIGEDSGLVVPALGGAPGIFSARYGGTHGDDAANNAKLLAELKPGLDRAAYYVSTAVLADPTGKVLASVEGRCWGVIMDEHRGTSGFGYDPLFLLPEYGQTFGQLPPEVKQKISHRANAFRDLREHLKTHVPR